MYEIHAWMEWQFFVTVRQTVCSCLGHIQDCKYVCSATVGASDRLILSRFWRSRPDLYIPHSGELSKLLLPPRSWDGNRPKAVREFPRYQSFKTKWVTYRGPARWLVWGATARSRCLSFDYDSGNITAKASKKWYFSGINVLKLRPPSPSTLILKFPALSSLSIQLTNALMLGETAIFRSSSAWLRKISTGITSTYTKKSLLS